MKARKLTIADLHDATFRGIWLDWPSGDARVELSAAVGAELREVRLQAREVTRLDCPRLSPWGPSVSILEVQRRATPTGVRLEIHMQRGDIVVLEAATVQLEVPPP